MYVNQIIETVLMFPDKSFEIQKQWIIDSLKASMKFHLGEIPGAVDSLLLKHNGSKMFRDDLDIPLPFHTTFLSFVISRGKLEIDASTSPSTKRGVLAVEDKREDRTLFLQYMYSDEVKMWIPSFFGLVRQGGKSELQIAPVIKTEAVLQNLGRALDAQEIREAFNSLNSDISVFNVFLELLTCKNIISETVHVDEILNKRRVKKGKLPLYDYKVLNLLLPGIRTDSNKSYSRGLDIKQRVHLCRGHFKEYTDKRPLFGKYVGRYWWQPIVRGKGDGMIAKEYQIKVNT